MVKRPFMKFPLTVFVANSKLFTLTQLPGLLNAPLSALEVFFKRYALYKFTFYFALLTYFTLQPAPAPETWPVSN